MAEVKSVSEIKTSYELQFPQYRSKFLAWCYLTKREPWNFFGQAIEDYRKWSAEMEVWLNVEKITEEKKYERIWYDVYMKRKEA